MIIISFVALVFLFILPSFVWFFVSHSKVLKNAYEQDEKDQLFDGSFAQYKDYRKFRFARGTRLMYYKLRLNEFCIIYIPAFIIIPVVVILTVVFIRGF